MAHTCSRSQQCLKLKPGGAGIVVRHETVLVKFAAGKTISRQAPPQGTQPQSNNCSLIPITRVANTGDQQSEAVLSGGGDGGLTSSLPLPQGGRVTRVEIGCLSFLAVVTGSYP